mmetsp:Transcript_19061/g.48762  ORF Transcript_19061/g.48762 Transcript_19061/m.48762 type:complete len:602 (-) Transcript_19061:1410-3215(-)
MGSYVIAVDVGSSSLRARAYAVQSEEGGRVEATPICVEEKLGLSEHGSFSSAIIVAEKGMKAVLEVVSKVETRDERASIISVGYCSCAMAAVPIFGRNEVEECLLYADQRTPSFQPVMSEAVKRRMGDDGMAKLNEKVGATVDHASFFPAHYLRLLHNDVGRLKKIKQWMGLGSYLLAHMIEGEDMLSVPTSFSEVSWWGMWEAGKEEWCGDVVSLLEDEARCASADVPLLSTTLPPTADVGEYVGKTKASLVRMHPSLSSTEWRLCVGDGAAAAIGSLCLPYSAQSKVGDVSVTIGTSAAVRLLLSSTSDRHTNAMRTLQPGCFRYVVCGDLHVIGGAMTDGGRAVDVMRDIMGVGRAPPPLPQSPASSSTSSSTFDGSSAGPAMSRKRRRGEGDASPFSSSYVPGSHCLTVLPFPGGERAPGMAAHASMSVVGIRRTTTAREVERAVMEAVVMHLLKIRQTLQSSLIEKDETVWEVRGSGTGLEQNPNWQRLVSDCFASVLHLPSHAVGLTSLGVALLLTAVKRRAERGGRGQVTEVVGEVVREERERVKAEGAGRELQPVLEHSAVYRSLADRQQQLYDVVVGRFEAPASSTAKKESQ